MFEITRQIIERLDDWVNALASPVIPLTRKTNPDGSFLFRFASETPGALLVAKAVRIASGLRAALILTDSRHTAEALSILRMVTDFSSEVMAIAEGVASERLTSSQRKFVQQFYADLPGTPDELEGREREFYPSRSDLLKAQKRLLEPAGIDLEEYQRLKRFLEKNLDSYVHGGYDSVMEMFHGGTQRFQVRGHASSHLVCLTMSTVSGKLYESLPPLAFIARLQGNEALADEIVFASYTLMDSREFYPSYCSELRGLSATA